MTMLFGARSPLQIPICRTIERYRAAQGKNDHTYLPHDLAARPAGSFPFPGFLTETDRHLFYKQPDRPCFRDGPLLLI